MQHSELQQTFLDNLGLIERTVRVLCRRYGVAQDDVDDVSSWIKTRFIEDGYSAIAKFRGESSITTYLTAVVAMHFRDYRNQRWGRWRPSAAAQRLGPHAVRLETLVVRDGLTLREAGERLRTVGETTLTDQELGKLLPQFPSRGPLRPVEVGAAAIAEQPAAAGADDHVWLEVADEEREATRAALERALAALPPEDQVVLRLRFWEGLSIADVARTLKLDQRPLYRRIEKALSTLRSQLESAGISWPESIQP